MSDEAKKLQVHLDFLETNVEDFKNQFSCIDEDFCEEINDQYILIDRSNLKRYLLNNLNDTKNSQMSTTIKTLAVNIKNWSWSLGKYPMAKEEADILLEFLGSNLSEKKEALQPVGCPFDE